MLNKKILILPAFLLGVLFIAGCSVTDNSSSVTSNGGSSEEIPAEKAETKKVKKKSKAEVISHNVKNEGYGYSALVGEVKNTGEIPMSFVKVTVTFYDENNEVTDTDFTYAGDTSDTALHPEKTTPFKMSIKNSTTKFDHYKLDVSWNDEEEFE